MWFCHGFCYPAPIDLGRDDSQIENETKNSLALKCKSHNCPLLDINKNILPQDYECNVYSIDAYHYNIRICIFYCDLRQVFFCSHHHDFFSLLIFGVGDTISWLDVDRVIEIYVMPNLYRVVYDVLNHYAACLARHYSSSLCADSTRIWKRESPVSMAVYGFSVFTFPFASFRFCFFPLFFCFHSFFFAMFVLFCWTFIFSFTSSHDLSMASSITMQ